MKNTIIMFLLFAGLLFGCNSNTNKRSHKAYGKKGKKAPYYAGNTKAKSGSASENSSSSSIKQIQTDTLLTPESNITYPRPGANYGSVSGPGSGGSYASSAYRHDEMNKKKYEKKSLTAMKQRKQMNQELEKIRGLDSASVKADSTNISWK